MTLENAHTPIPAAVLAFLRNITGEEFKVIGVLCYQTYNQQTPQITIEQIQSLTGIPRDKIKPTLYQLMRRGWVVDAGGLYQLALQQPQSDSTRDAFTQYDPMLGIRPPRPKPHLLYPEGPWLTENGLLNEDFVRDRAQVWRTGDHPQAKTFSAMAIEDVMGVVCKYYAKPINHASLEIDWQSYCLKNRRYLTNIQQRLQSGAVINEEEQTIVFSKIPAVIQEAEPVYESPAPQPLAPAAPPLPAPKQAALESSESVQAAFQGMLTNRIMPVDRVGRSQMTPVEKLKLWLSDPILRPEAERLAMAQGYELGYSPEGVAIDIIVK